MSSADQVAQILQLVYDVRATYYSSMVAFTLLAYDILTTLDEEVRLMWPRPWNTFNYLYFWSRYCTLAIISVSIILFMQEIRSDHVCRTFLITSGTISTFSVLSIDMILLLRVWILYGRGRVLFWIFVGLILVELASMLALIALTFSPLTSFVHIGTLVGGCYPSRELPRLLQFYAIPALAVSLIGFFLTMRKCITTLLYNKVELPVMSLFLRDGAVWFLVIALAMIGEMIVWARIRSSLGYVMILVNLSAYAVVGSRVLLNIKDMLETATIIGLGTADETPPSEPIAFRAAPNATTLSDRMGDGISVGD